MHCCYINYSSFLCLDGYFGELFWAWKAITPVSEAILPTVNIKFITPFLNAISVSMLFLFILDRGGKDEWVGRVSNGSKWVQVATCIF